MLDKANLVSSNLQHIAPTPHPETAQSATNSWMTSSTQQAGSRQAERPRLPPQEVLVEAHERGWLSPGQGQSSVPELASGEAVEDQNP